MKYNLVLHDSGWVMEKLVDHFLKYLPDSHSSTAASSTDVNFYFNWHGLTKKTHFDICFFTHIEDRAYWDKVVDLCDVAVLMGDRYADTVSPEKRIIFYPPPFEKFLSERKVKILVVGREYSSKRKNFALAEALRILQNVEIRYTDGKLSEDEVVQAYKDTDYVLVTSSIEAGPMCVVEAISMGKPVIAPDVGWCWQYPCIKYSGNQELVSILSSLSFSTCSWETRVRSLHYKISRKFFAISEDL